MPDPCDPLRAQIRRLQAQCRSWESKLMQPQSTVTCVPHAFRFAAGTLPGHRRVPAKFPEPEGVAAGHCGPATAVEAVAAGPVPIKHFYLFLSISLDIGPPVCQI